MRNHCWCSGYTKVAQGKGRLGRLLLAQAVIQITGILWTLFSILQHKSPNQLIVSSLLVGFTSVAIGELVFGIVLMTIAFLGNNLLGKLICEGRRRNYVSLLKFYIFVAAVAAVLCTLLIIRSDFLLQVFFCTFILSSLLRRFLVTCQ